MKDISFPKDHFQLIAMGASTGGTEALLAVLERLPATLPPIVITQHMPAVFTKMYADRLNKICKMEVREAADGDKLYPGLCLIAPGGLTACLLYHYFTNFSKYLIVLTICDVYEFSLSYQATTCTR